jgi:hypothetical protein
MENTFEVTTQDGNEGYTQQDGEEGCTRDGEGD